MRLLDRPLARAITALLVVGCGDDIPDVVDDESPLPVGSDTGSATTGEPDPDPTTGATDTGDTVPSVEWPTLECDPIAPGYCAYPFPSNVFTVADDTTATGRRIELPLEAFTMASNEPWEALDGFSASAALLVHLPDATGVGLAGPDAIPDSIGDDSLTVLLDAESGERIAHFAELDFTTGATDERALMIRPAARLLGGRRYIVAVRGVVDSSGAVIDPSPAFTALRDGTDLADEPSVEERRGLYADIFARLDDAGVPRDDLQIAWDFTTASDDLVTGRLLHMRDETFEALGDGAPSYTLDQVIDAPDPGIAFLVRGTFQAPLYLTSTEAQTGRLRIGDDGRPVAEGTMDVGFSILVPESATTTPAALLQHGHGLFGTASQVEGDHFVDMATTYNYAPFAVNWLGMSDGDAAATIGTIGAGSAEGLASMMDRLHQGALNQLLAMRLVSAGLVDDPQFEGLLDPEQRYYYGISQGGILGGVYMALSTEVTRGVLDVMGQPYNLLLSRSVDFDAFFTFMKNKWPDAREYQYILAVTQMLWDRAEPSGWSLHIRDPLPGTPAHEVLMTAALGDHQVPTLGAHVMARSIDGLVHLDTGVREIWGLESATDAHTGSAYVEYDFGLPPDPICNLPQRACDDPHGKLRKLTAARDQIDHFLRTGEVDNFCPDGHCRFTDDNGCAPGERTPDVCE